MHAIVHAADVQDRDGGALLMASLFGAFPFLIKLYADGGYQGPEFQNAVKRILARVNVEIVKRSDQTTGFVALPSARSSNALRLARPLPTPGQGLGMSQPQGPRLPAPRLHPPDAAKTMRIPDDVLGQTLEQNYLDSFCRRFSSYSATERGVETSYPSNWSAPLEVIHPECWSEDHFGGWKRWQGSDTSRKRSSRSCGRLMS